jgi:hypothetical protein
MCWAKSFCSLNVSIISVGKIRLHTPLSPHFLYIMCPRVPLSFTLIYALFGWDIVWNLNSWGAGNILRHFPLSAPTRRQKWVPLAPLQNTCFFQLSCVQPVLWSRAIFYAAPIFLYGTGSLPYNSYTKHKGNIMFVIILTLVGIYMF